MKKKQIAGMILAGIVSAGSIISSAFAGNVYAQEYPEEYLGDGPLEFSFSVGIGEVRNLNDVFDKYINAQETISWSVSESSVAAIDANGNIMGIMPGEVFVTAYTADGDLPLTSTVRVLFDDVQNDESPFVGSIYWAANRGITTGFDDNTFRQDDICTRGQIVTFLDRATFRNRVYSYYLGLGESYSFLNEINDIAELDDIKKNGTWDWDIEYSEDVFGSESDEIVTLDANGTLTGNTLGDAKVCVNYGQSKKSFDIKVVKFFDDVKNRESVFFDSIYWAYGDGITTGFNDNNFRPDNYCTRGQIVTLLWRAFGKPEPNSKETTLTDLNEKSAFFKAILWASERGITTGFEDNTFRADDACTRGQAVTFLYRAFDTGLFAIEE